MKIQKGLVKYKDRSDIVCTYAITSEGKQFYFLSDSKLSNDNIIVTTSLVEAIDPSVVCANIGVIDSTGKVVIECNNKAIKLITKDILLVESSNPTSPSVIESVKLRKDPLAATNLVSTPAMIKDKIYSLMGTDGRFLFNDQFSEASLCDLNGNNLLDNKYYSFISINKKGDTLYLCGNTKESVPDTFSLVTMKFNDDTNVDSSVEVPAPSEEVVNVADATVDKQDIDNAMEGVEVPSEDAVPSEVAPTAAPEVPDLPEVPTDAVPSEVAPTDEVEASEEAPEVPVDIPEVPAPEEESVEVPTEDDLVAPEVAQEEALPTPEVPTDVEETNSGEEGPTSLEDVLNISAAPPVPSATIPIDSVDIVPPVETPIPNVDNGLAPGEVVDDLDTPAEENVEEPALPIEEEIEKVEVPEEEVESTTETKTVSPEEVQEMTKAIEEPIKDDGIDEIQSILNVVDSSRSNNKVQEVEPEEDFSNLDTYVNDAPRIDEKPSKSNFDDFLENSNFDYGNNYNNDYSSSNLLDDIEDDRMYNRDRNTSRYSNDGIMNDAAKTLTKLIDANKSQRSEINSYKDQVRELTTLNKRVVDKARHDRDRMKNSIDNYASEVDRLKSQMEAMEDRMHEKERIISNQSAELSNLRVQVEGRNNLQKILNDAESLLGNDKY